MRLPPSLLLPLVLLPLALCSCMQDRTEGLITTYDGKFVVGTAEAVTDDLTHRWAAQARDAAGPDWGAVVTIHGTPVFSLVQPDEFGWPQMQLDLVLTPPRGTPGESTAAAAERAAAELKSLANYRIVLGAVPQVATTVLKAGELPAGATLYTVVEGDTLATISAAFYGSTQYWRRIADANLGVAAGDLKAGVELVIPAKP